MNLPTLPRFRLILLLYILFAFSYSLLMPLWEAPDETAHYLVILRLAQRGTMPTVDETYEAIQPPPYYWLAAQLFRLLGHINPELITPYRPPLSTGDTLTRYHWTAENYRITWGAQILRWLNIVWGGLTLFFIYKGVSHFTRTTVRPNIPIHDEGSSQLLPIATVAMVGLLPQFLYNSASLSNDPLANAAGACLFWLLGVVCTAQVHTRYRVLIGAAAVAFPILIKLTILPMSITVLLVLFWQGWRHYRTHRAWLAVGGVLLALFLGAGIRLARIGGFTLAILRLACNLYPAWCLLRLAVLEYRNVLCYQLLGAGGLERRWPTGMECCVVNEPGLAGVVGEPAFATSARVSQPFLALAVHVI